MERVRNFGREFVNALILPQSPQIRVNLPEPASREQIMNLHRVNDRADLITFRRKIALLGIIGLSIISNDRSFIGLSFAAFLANEIDRDTLRRKREIAYQVVLKRVGANSRQDF